MKKIKFLLVAILTLLIIPFSVFAEEEVEEISEDVEINKKINVYLFRGDGCPHCAEAEEFFDSIKEEYGEYFELKDFEVWKNTENAELLDKVAEARGEEVDGVPYIIIGNKSWNGYSNELSSDMKDAIKAEYDVELTKRYDIMELIDTGSTGKGAKSTAGSSTGSDAITLVAILIVVAGIVTGVVMARKKTV